MSLVAVDPKNETSVVALLEHAAQWLAEAVHRGEPGDVAVVKAQMHAAEDMAKQLNLSKEIQLDAQEMVRRAEYALDRAIRRAQAEGTGEVNSLASGGPRGPYERGGKIVNAHPDQKPIGMSPRDFFGGNAEARSAAYQMGAVPPEEFNEALEEAKAEGNLSRANVVRKVKQQAGPTTRSQRADLIADLAAQGYSSRQMPEQVGVSEESVRQIARDFDIEIPADRSTLRTRHINSTNVVANTVSALEGLVMGVELIDYDELDLREASQWADSLKDSLRVLNRFAKKIKETTQ